MSDRKLWVIVMLLLLFFYGCNKNYKNTNHKIKNSPNVVVIVIDTLRADHLPFYGYSENTTPFMASLAKKSVLFENTFTASSWTAPATASLFTSMYPFQHKVVMNMLATLQFNSRIKQNYKIKLNRIPKGITTIAESFKQQGYATYGVADNVNIGKKEGFEQGFDKMITYNYKTADIVNKTILNWESEMKKKDRYFLYIQYMDVHQPNHKRERWFKNRKLKNNGGLPINKVPVEIKKFNQELYYDSELNYVDAKIKELYDRFKWDKNTLVIITADHGEEFWEHGKWGHGHALFREVIHIPLLFHYSNGGFKTNRIKQNVSIIDILPTLREFIGLPRDKANEGLSLLKILTDGEQNTINNRFIFSHLLKRKTINNKMINIESYATIYNKFHYIKSLPGIKGNYSELIYNLKDDFIEKHNLFLQNKNTAKKLRSQFLHFYNKCRKFKSDIQTYKGNKKEMERLKTLGYTTENK